MYILLAILAFSLLIISHEFGHFIMAKLNNVKVEEFSLGMGPKIVGIKGKETEYLIKALPIGGYVKMLGEEEKTDDPRAFSNKSSLRKLSIVAAGPIMNLILAVILYIIIGFGKGFAIPEVSGVIDKSPAQQYLKVGDKVVEINNKKVTTWDDLSAEIIANGKNPINLKVERKTAQGIETQTYNIIPTYNEEEKRYLVGIEPTYVESPSIGQSITYGFHETKSWIKQTFSAFKYLFSGKASMNDVGGPVTIIKASGAAAKAGIYNLLFFCAFLSIQLAIFNIIPFPALDGGWIFLFLFEIITRKKVDDKKVAVINYIGFSILMLLMVLVLVKDVIYPINF